jgi:hypothetical protein
VLDAAAFGAVRPSLHPRFAELLKAKLLEERLLVPRPHRYWQSKLSEQIPDEPQHLGHCSVMEVFAE